ncbi:MAG: long-chain-fatty-acid--CoA ligase [Chloroflexi bacterium]|nr:long-chain-fatty-acid--CoA ligase [Chloroflexota bacterium]
MSKSPSYEALSPTLFLDRSAGVYPDKAAVVYGDKTYTYSEFNERVRRLAAALKQAGVGRGDRVAFLVPNIPAMLEGHYGPMRLGAVLVAINIRLSAREIGYILNHSGSKVLVFDSEYAPTITKLKDEVPAISTFIQVVDTEPKSDDVPGPDYEEFLAAAPDGDPRVDLESELDTIAIDYTSGTTGMPKGVEYHARGAYLSALGEALETGMNWRTVYLWTLPMFHCNGWCFTWAVTAMGGTHVCLRRVDAGDVYDSIKNDGVSHMCAAPTVLTALYSSPLAGEGKLSGVRIVTAGAPPAPQVIRTIEAMGAVVEHMYGLTETYGPMTIAAGQPEWDEMSVEERAQMKSRQGVPFITGEPGLRVVDEKMNDVPRDGETMGEVVMRGNMVMSGYYNDPEATAKAFAGGWFHSGDLAVRHPDGYIDLRDRAKDVIISGGENISSQEVEKVIMEHPAVMEVCIVGVPDEKWGEVPKAFVVRNDGAEVTGEEIIAFTRDRIAHFKAPKHVEFGELPKTATGKIQKYILREKEWAGHERRIN